ncbi:hypothetical protein [Antribacter gilvus]|uniref:hypothetical protein n=1 Tax=Antribacter gilvus TaxID=2304675 RepID=UPI000F779A02|nr:hypothetical protein [Antribacter gilvus]
MSPASTPPGRWTGGRAATSLTVCSWALVVLFVVVTLGSPLAGRTTFLGVDLMLTTAPWSSALGPGGSHVPFVGDTVDSVVPQSVLIVDGAREGYLAEWNPYQSGGSELGGMPNSGVYSPLSLPWWIFPHEYAPGAVKLLEIVAIAAGMSLLLRRYGLPPAAWALATAVYSASGFMISWTNWPQTRVAALIPLLFWVLDRAAVRPRWWDAGAVGLVVGSMLLGGFPAVTAYGLYAGAAYVVVRAAVVHRSVLATLRAGVVAFAGVLFGFVLAGWQIVPFAYNAMTVIDFDVRQQGTSSHLALDALVTAFVPDLLGTANSPAFWGAASPVERLSYVGMAAVVLVGAALAVRGRQRPAPSVVPFLLGGLALTVVLVYVGGPVLGLFQHLPVFSNNPVARVRVLVGFFAALVAAFGLAAVLDARRPVDGVLGAGSDVRERLVVVVRLLGALALAAGVTALVVSVARRAPDHVHAAMQVRGAFVVTIAAVSLVLLAWFVRRRWVSVVAGIGLVALVVGPAASLARSWWPTPDADLFYASTPTHEFLDENLGGDRYATLGQVMLPGTSTMYQQRSLGGHVFMTSEWREALLAVDDMALLTPTYSILHPANVAHSLTNPLLDRLAVRYVVAGPADGLVGRMEPGPAGEATALPVGRTLTAEGSGPARGVLVTFPEAVGSTGPEGLTLTVRLRGTDGEPLAETSTTASSLAGGRFVALAADDLAAETPWTVELEISGAPSGGSVQTLSDGTLAYGTVRPADDGLRVAHTGDATVYERTTALPRVRWAGSELAVEDVEDRVRALTDPATPHDAVVLEDTEDLQGLDGSSGATVTEVVTDLDHVTAEVDAQGDGWVVVADSFRREGWTASLDGEPVPLVAAEHVAGAVFVPEGEHVVELEYRTPLLREGLWVSAAGLVLLAGGAALAVAQERRRGRAAGSSPRTAETP